jgi:DNA polymerase-4/protein ImuB
MQAQFGPEGRRIWELARGIDSSPFIPRRSREAIEVDLSFPTPTMTLAAIAIAVESLLVRAFAQPAMHGRYARVCTLSGAVFRAPRWEKQMVFREPVGDCGKALALIRHTLEGQPPPGPLEDLSLTLTDLTGEAGRQETFLGDVRKLENLQEAMRQLRVRLRKQPPIYQVREVEPWSRFPERRLALMPYVP